VLQDYSPGFDFEGEYGTEPRLSHMAMLPPMVVRLVGMLRGRELNMETNVGLHPDAVVFASRTVQPWKVMTSSIEGLTYTATHLTLYLADGDVLDITGDEMVRTLAMQLTDYACTVPELMRGLRSMGSTRGWPGAAHDAWFAPLLAIRRGVYGVSDPTRQITLVDAQTLADTMQRAMAEVAALSAPGDPARQRAIEAAMEEDAHDLWRAIRRLGLAADALRGGAMDTLFLDWRRWSRALLEVFVTADDAWDRSRRVL
jgi:hypothetical protein